MITNFLLSIPALLLNAIIGFLPNGGVIPASWVSGVYTIWGDINAFSFIVPVNTLLVCLGIAMTFHLGVMGFHIVNWILKKIPGIN